MKIVGRSNVEVEPSRESNEEMELKLRGELERLGLYPLRFERSEEKPDVDLIQLQRLARGELSTTAAQLLYRFIARYEDWYEAYVRMLAQAED